MQQWLLMLGAFSNWLFRTDVLTFRLKLTKLKKQNWIKVGYQFDLVLILLFYQEMLIHESNSHELLDLEKFHLKLYFNLKINYYYNWIHKMLTITYLSTSCAHVNRNDFRQDAFDIKIQYLTPSYKYITISIRF